ncbi:hypothetical protein [Salibacterium halotolerans]|uniref:Uncharacterized protein n=1 Tax=Salibacterium halotolerans TaxID=1884432 RepID=A0A1I5SFL7_9BACI|nr:hypothetical protein [Salibacterium halotolerans]SFP69126.1 hypothetical protein SAMN05518683_108152 [Salibacterium halotolerans]
MFNVIITIVVILAITGSIAAWINTRIIIEEIGIIKKELGIPERPRDHYGDVFDSDTPHRNDTEKNQEDTRQ